MQFEATSTSCGKSVADKYVPPPTIINDCITLKGKGIFIATAAADMAGNEVVVAQSDTGCKDIVVSNKNVCCFYHTWAMQEFDRILQCVRKKCTTFTSVLFFCLLSPPAPIAVALSL